MFGRVTSRYGDGFPRRASKQPRADPSPTPESGSRASVIPCDVPAVVPHDSGVSPIQETDFRYLPRLDKAGYVEWDIDSKTVSREPEFSDIEPLLRLLNE